MHNQGIMFQPHLWLNLTEQLRRRGEGCHEAGAFLLGSSVAGKRSASGVIYYDDLDPRAYSTGVCVLHSGAFADLWQLCRARRLTVVADVHTHPMGARQSLIDRRNPMVARAGHVAIIIPNFAAAPVLRDGIGVFVYQGHHTWNDQSPFTGSTFLSI